MRELEREVNTLKQMYADLALENRVLKEVIEQQALRPPDSFDALEESVFLMHVAANLGVIQ